MFTCIDFITVLIYVTSLSSTVLSVFHAKKGHWLFMMDRRNGTNWVIFVKNEKPVTLALFLDSNVVLWDNSQKETHGGLMLQYVGLFYLSFVLSAFCGPEKQAGSYRLQFMIIYGNCLPF